MACEMCGNKEARIKAEIEGVELTVCSNCAVFGRVLSRPRAVVKNKPVYSRPAKEPVPEIIERVLDDYHVKIKSAREKRGMKQEEFSKMLNERESIMQKIESGKLTPSIALARKLEKMLRLNIVEEIKVEKQKEESVQKSSGALTIGDMLYSKKR